MSSSPGYLALSGLEVANNARTAAYLQAGLGSPQFEITYGEICPELIDLAYPLEVCEDLGDTWVQGDQLYASPLAGWRSPAAAGAPAAAQAAWFAAGYLAIPGAGVGDVNAGVVLPDSGQVAETVRLSINVAQVPATSRSWAVCRLINAGTANVGAIGVALVKSVGPLHSIQVFRRLPNGGATSYTPFGGTPASAQVAALPDNYWLEVEFTSIGFTATVYGSDPAVAGAPVILGPNAYGYDPTPTSTWRTATGVFETTQFAAVTEVGIITGTGVPMWSAAEAVITEVDVLPPDCTATGSSYPSGGAWPGSDIYPAHYGYFTNPGADNAPWVDPLQPASYGFLGMILVDIENIDTTETRSLEQAASGRGGILGPQMMAPRHLTCKGWLIAQGCASMEYARRWLADALAGELCPGCDSLEADYLPLCDAEDGTGLRRLYDAGLEALEVDTSDVQSCCYVTPVQFTLAVADPFVYTLPEYVVVNQAIAPLAADTPDIPFESWLFESGAEVCVPLADEGLGQEAAIVTLYGGATGLSGGLVYRSQGHYPQASMFPGECVYPASGTPQWDIAQCPFVFSVSIGAGEYFTVDSSRQRVDWQLSDGTVLNGAPKLALAPGQTIQWIDTCDGDDAQVCVRASANCTCDTSAAVTVATQHSER